MLLPITGAEFNNLAQSALVVARGAIVIEGTFALLSSQETTNII